jgi:antitoxin YefM
VRTIDNKEFSENIAQYIDAVHKNKEPLTVTINDDQGIVLIDLNEYNSLIETLHLVGSFANHKRHTEFITEMKSGNLYKH